MARSVPESISFPEEEENLLKYWKEIDAFRTSLKQSKGRPRYTFYDGPPFATGLPHYGHILAGTMKDVVTRWAHQSGFHVERRFGWDCHGLPVEYEIDKTLGIKGPDDVIKMGIEAYNKECKKIVMRYSKEWEDIVTRLGRWIDFENDYKTMYPSFMESVWWVFNELYNRGLVYKGFKVMPFSTACNTPLSNFETSQNYKEVVDPAVIISFPLIESPDVSLIAWTTTPWTLPSNLSLCVNPEMDYVQVKDNSNGHVYIMMEARLEALFKKPEEYVVIDKFKGKSLEGRQYKPLFEYFAYMRGRTGAFKVLVDNYVTAESGTGVVHQAPYFGEDDQRVCLHYGVITKDMDMICPVDASGKFTEEVHDFKGMYVKDADKLIIKKLKDIGRLVHSSTTKHSYPFCWRSETPLIYKAVPCWFVRVEHASDKLLDNNAKTYWVPDFVKEKRFANWLKDARDWCISRNRYWGTPIPIWLSEDGEEGEPRLECVPCQCPLTVEHIVVRCVDFHAVRQKYLDMNCLKKLYEDVPPKKILEFFKGMWFVVSVGSIEELEKLSGVKVADLHRDTTVVRCIGKTPQQLDVDKVTIPSKLGKGTLRRVPEVFDCWFESGSMPYAQVHYPFENKKEFEECFPADFIAEGIDQTRGWFYTLLVLSTLLFGKPPFKNLICNGLVLASDGQKMSKSKKNYPDPMEVVKKYGADALRLYLCNSPAVRADNLRFQEDGVKDVLKDVFIPWYNAYRFLMQNVERLEKEEGIKFLYNTDKPEVSNNYMDRWILSFTQSLIRFVRQEMQAYKLYTVMPRLVKFVDQLTNWYVRMNRKRLKGDNGADDCQQALETLFSVLFAMTKVMSPMIPFITDYMYQNLKHMVDPECTKGQDTRSVHFLLIPEVREDLIDIQIERAVSRMQSVIELGRLVRDRNTLPTKYPLKEVVAIAKDEEVLQDMKSLESYIIEELNVKVLTVTANKEKYGAHVHAEPDHKVLGSKLKGDFKRVTEAIRQLTDEQLTKFQAQGEINVEGFTLLPEDLRLMYKFDASSDSTPNCYDAHSDDQVLVLLNVTPDQSMLDEGVAREVINRIQKLRKKAKLVPTDNITVYYQAPKELGDIIVNFGDFIYSTIKQPLVPYPVPTGTPVIVQENFKFKTYFLDMTIVKRKGEDSTVAETLTTVLSPVSVRNAVRPNCSFVNVQLCGMSTGEGVEGAMGTVLLENPHGHGFLDAENLKQQIQSLFGVRSSYVALYRDFNLKQELGPSTDFRSLDASTLYVSLTSGKKSSGPAAPLNISSPVCHFANLELTSKTSSKRKGTLLLENPSGNSFTLEQLREQIYTIFELDGTKVRIFSDESQKKELTHETVPDILSLHSSTIFVAL